MLRDDLIFLYKKAIKFSNKMRDYGEEVGDFAGWWVLKLLEGKSLHQSISLAFIDFLRETKGGTNNRRSADALKHSHYRSLFVKFENGSEEEYYPSNQDLPDEVLEKKENDIDYSVFLKKDIHITIYKLIVDEGLSLCQIGEKLGFTESRACQHLRDIRKILEEELGIGYNEIYPLTDLENEQEIDWIKI